MFHISAMYRGDESKPGYFYSGARARSSAVLRVLSEALGGGKRQRVDVRMRSPFAGPASGGSGSLELRFTVPASLGRVPLGGAGRFSKRPLALMDYLGNRFDADPLWESFPRDRPSLAVFDHLSSFALSGWDWRGRRAPRAVYLSHDYEPEFATDWYLRSLINKRIDSALRKTDLLVVASERDRLSYLSHGILAEDRVVVYPNIFPPAPGWEGGAELKRSSAPFTLAMVATGWLGERGSREDAEFLGSALRLLPRARVRVLSFGDELGAALARVLPDTVELRAFGRVPERDDFLRALSGAHAGLNLAHWAGGTNVKKYDYALAGLVVLSNPLGARGGLIPHEWTFADGADLVAKVAELMDLGSSTAARMGRENSEAVVRAEGSAASVLRAKVAGMFEGGG